MMLKKVIKMAKSMCYEINVSESEFNEMKDNLFTSKNLFLNTIFDFINKKKQGPPKGVILTLPCSVSRAQRHTLHKYSQQGIWFNSYGEGKERFMEIELSSNFISTYGKSLTEIECVSETTIDEDSETDDDVQSFVDFRNKVLADFKQNLYDDLMKVMNKYF